MNCLFIIVLLILNLLVIYHKPRMWLWSLVMFVYFISVYPLAGSSVNLAVYILLALFSALIVVVGNIPWLRFLITRPIYLRAKKILPSISETEQLALDAGDSWWEKDVFQGKPDFNKLHGLQKFTLSQEEQDFLANETNQLCALINDWEATHNVKDFPAEVWDFMRQKGFFGLVIKKEFGGKGFSAAAHSEIVMKVATRSTSAAVTVMVPNSLGPGELLYHYGTEEQKNYYLPRLARGEEIPCFALTGPTAGSDATSIPDLGIVCMQEFNGKVTLGIRLQNIDKRYITLAPVATLVGLAFQLKDPDGLLGGVGRAGITCALLPHTHPGLEIGNRLIPLDQIFMNGTVRIKDSFIPMDWVIGGQQMAGEGWRMLVECLSIGRAISLPGCGTANALLSSVTTSAYALVREQFKVPIGSFEGVQEGLGKIGGLTYMMNATRQFTVAAVDGGVRPSVASAIAKYHLTEAGRTVLNWAMDIHGGRAIIMGPNNYLGRMYQGAPIAITVEGANIMTRNLMIFGQGAMRCHPYIRKIYESLMKETGLAEFDKAIFGHIGYFAQNKTRALFHAFTAGKFATGYSSRFNNYYKQITRLSSAAAIVSDLVLIILNGNIKIKERLSARLGDAMSHLYMASATLKYFKDQGESDADEVFVRWSLEYCLFQAQNALVKTLANFSLQPLAKIYRWVLFPYGLPYNEPSDYLEQQVAKALLSDGGTRQSFKREIYLNPVVDDPVGRMEVAFQAAVAAAAIKEKILQAMRNKLLPKASPMKNAAKALELGVITQDELEKLELSAKYTNEVIQVDEFASYELGPKNAHPSWNATN